MANFDVNVRPEHKQLFINNQWCDSLSGRTFATINPATGNVICHVQEADKEDVDVAVKAAKCAFSRGSQWRETNPADRGKLLQRLADLVEEDAVQLASLEVLDNGKTMNDAYNDMMGAADIFRYFAGYSDKNHGKVIPANGPYLCYTRHEPVGVVAAILPWNFPILMLAEKLAPALTCGNVIIIKPAEQTPLSSLRFASLIPKAGFPPGVVNIVTGYGPTAGAALSHHMEVNKVAFTGSTEVGKLIQKASADSNLKRVNLELGGKSPNIIFDDAGDLDTLVKEAQSACVAVMGQVCCAGSRTFVHESIYDEFVAKSKELATTIKVGNAAIDDVDQGPQIDLDQYNKILSYIHKGVQEGATLQCGGAPCGDVGYFIKPTVFSDVEDHMSIARDEIFGPVQSILKFSDVEEVIRRANDTCYGLAAAVYTKDIEKAMQVSNGLEAGTVSVNCYLPDVGFGLPFGGYKQSGTGREYGEYGLQNYYEVKSVVIKIG